jgi:hypothetical protein
MDGSCAKLEIFAKLWVYLQESTSPPVTPSAAPKRHGTPRWNILMVQRPGHWHPHHWSEEPPAYRVVSMFHRDKHSRARRVIREINQASIEANGNAWAIIR